MTTRIEAWLYTYQCWRISARLAASCGNQGGISRTCCRNATWPLPRGSCIATADPRADDQAAGEGGRDGPLVAGELEEEAGRAAAGLCRSRGPLGCRAHARRLPAAG